MSLLTTSIESSSAPDFFTMAIQTRDNELLYKEREIYGLRETIDEQGRMIEELRARVKMLLNPHVAIDIAPPVASSSVGALEEAPVEVATEHEDKKTTKHRKLKDYLITGDRVVHTIKNSEWCVCYDGDTDVLVGTGGAYKSLKDFVLAHRAELDRTIKNMLPWSECKVMRNGSYVKMNELSAL
jgi:hypothetical protein